MNRYCALLALCAFTLTAADQSKKKASSETPLDAYISEALAQPAQSGSGASQGSLWSPASRLTDLGSDVRASQMNDLVTIVVAERASAVATGSTKTSRSSNVKSSVTSLAGVTNPAGKLANLAGVGSATSLDGSGATARGSELTTTLSARVTHVLPNGYLVLEGAKDVQVNSERQQVTIRGIVRPVDLTPGNLVSSNQIAQMEIRINGKGVVNDSVRRPFFLYRLLLGLLPL